MTDITVNVENIFECGGRMTQSAPPYLGVGCWLLGGESYTLWVAADYDGSGSPANFLDLDGTTVTVEGKIKNL